MEKVHGKMYLFLRNHYDRKVPKIPWVSYEKSRAFQDFPFSKSLSNCRRQPKGGQQDDLENHLHGLSFSARDTIGT
jgi:hypothetical protein